MKGAIKMFRRWMAMILVMLMFAIPARAMGLDRAKELVKAADPRAAKARQFWVYPEGDGAWVFYGTGYNSKEALFKGGFWYVTEDARYPLGDYTERVLHWDHLQSDPPVFTSCTLRRGKKHPHAAILREGVPEEITDFGQLECEFSPYNGGDIRVVPDEARP